MNTIILRAATAILLPLLLIFSVFIFLRGHYLPGGGFVGGLIASIGFVLYFFAHGIHKTKKMFAIHPGFLMPLGLLMAFIAGVLPIVADQLPYLKALWLDFPVPALGMLGTPVLFDLGVYVVVLGVTLTIIFTITESA